MSSLNQDALDSIRDLQSEEDPQVLVALIELFLKTAYERLEVIEKAAASGKGSALQAAAHSLKSSSASLGMTDVAASCAELERLGKQNTLETAPWVAKRLRSEFDGAIAELNNLPEMKARPSDRKAA
jgi:HPt (histidine-containing phosphotransfer) domain-containing protein